MSNFVHVSFAKFYPFFEKNWNLWFWCQKTWKSQFLSFYILSSTLLRTTSDQKIPQTRRNLLQPIQCNYGTFMSIVIVKKYECIHKPTRKLIWTIFAKSWQLQFWAFNLAVNPYQKFKVYNFQFRQFSKNSADFQKDENNYIREPENLSGHYYHQKIWMYTQKY